MEAPSSPEATAQRLASENSSFRAADVKSDRSAVALQLAVKILANRREALTDDQRRELLRLSNHAELTTAKLTLRLCDILLQKGGAGEEGEIEECDGAAEDEGEGGAGGGAAGQRRASTGALAETGGAHRQRARGFSIRTKGAVLVALLAAAWVAVKRNGGRAGLRKRMEALWPVLQGFAADGWEWFWEGICEGARFRFFEGLFCLALAQLVCRLPRPGAALLEWMLD